MCGCTKAKKAKRVTNSTPSPVTNKSIPLGMDIFVPLQVPLDLGEIDNWGRIIVASRDSNLTKTGAIVLRGHNALVSPILRKQLSDKYPALIPPHVEEGVLVESVPQTV